MQQLIGLGIADAILIFLIVAELMPENCPSVFCDMPLKFLKCLIFSPIVMLILPIFVIFVSV